MASQCPSSQEEKYKMAGNYICIGKEWDADMAGRQATITVRERNSRETRGRRVSGCFAAD